MKEYAVIGFLNQGPAPHEYIPVHNRGHGVDRDAGILDAIKNAAWWYSDSRDAKNAQTVYDAMVAARSMTELERQGWGFHLLAVVELVDGMPALTDSRWDIDDVPGGERTAVAKRPLFWVGGVDGTGGHFAFRLHARDPSGAGGGPIGTVSAQRDAQWARKMVLDRVASPTIRWGPGPARLPSDADVIGMVEQRADGQFVVWREGFDTEIPNRPQGPKPIGSRASSSTPASSDLDVVNRHRKLIGAGPLDLSAGWSAEEIAEMAENIRTKGRTHNPKLKRKLMR